MSDTFLLTITHVTVQPVGSHVADSLQGETRRWYFVERTKALAAYNIAVIASGNETNQSFGRNTNSISFQDSAKSITIRLIRLPQ